MKDFGYGLVDQGEAKRKFKTEILKPTTPLDLVTGLFGQYQLEPPQRDYNDPSASRWFDVIDDHPIDRRGSAIESPLFDPRDEIPIGDYLNASGESRELLLLAVLPANQTHSTSATYDDIE